MSEYQIRQQQLEGCCDDCLCGCPLGYEAESQLKAADELARAAKAVRNWNVAFAQKPDPLAEDVVFLITRNEGEALIEALAAYEKVRGSR